MTEQELRDAISEIVHNHNDRGIGYPPKPVEYFLVALMDDNLTLTQLQELYDDIKPVE
jgi:hypothetical protein